MESLGHDQLMKQICEWKGKSNNCVLYRRDQSWWEKHENITSYFTDMSGIFVETHIPKPYKVVV